MNHLTARYIILRIMNQIKARYSNSSKMSHRRLEFTSNDQRITVIKIFQENVMNYSEYSFHFVSNESCEYYNFQIY